MKTPAMKFTEPNIRTVQIPLRDKADWIILGVMRAADGKFRAGYRYRVNGTGGALLPAVGRICIPHRTANMALAETAAWLLRSFTAAQRFQHQAACRDRLAAAVRAVSRFASRLNPKKGMR